MNANNTNQNGYSHKGVKLGVDDEISGIQYLILNPQDRYRRFK